MSYIIQIKAKKEICWDEAEQKDKERSQLRATYRRHDETSSSENEEEGQENGILKQHKRTKRQLCKKKSLKNHREYRAIRGDCSETLYETEYQSDPAHVQSEPDESEATTPPRVTLDRAAYSTPCVNKRRHLPLLRGSVIKEQGKRVSTCENEQAILPQTDDELVSGYDTATGYHSGPGEHISSDSDTLEYIGTPTISPRSTSPIPDILCQAPQVPPSMFDKSLPVKIQYGEESLPVGGCCDSNFQAQQELLGSCDLCRCTYCQDAYTWSNRSSSTPPSVDASHDESCDNHVNSRMDNVCFCRHTELVNQLPCLHCCTVQPYNLYHHPQPCPHSSHPYYHTAPVHTPHLQPCKLDPTFNPSVPINNLVDTHLNRAVPIGNLVDPTLVPFSNSVEPDVKLSNPLSNNFAPNEGSSLIAKPDNWSILPLPQPKRRLDSEPPDLFPNGIAPLAKKQCR